MEKTNEQEQGPDHSLINVHADYEAVSKFSSPEGGGGLVT